MALFTVLRHFVFSYGDYQVFRLRADDLHTPFLSEGVFCLGYVGR
jgi:hypothetical protein